VPDDVTNLAVADPGDPGDQGDPVNIYAESAQIYSDEKDKKMVYNDKVERWDENGKSYFVFIPTVGAGHRVTAKDINPATNEMWKVGEKVPKETRKRWFQGDIKKAVGNARSLTGFSKFDIEAKKILVNMMFNMGPGWAPVGTKRGRGVKSFVKMLKALRKNPPDYARAAAEMEWSNADLKLNHTNWRKQTRGRAKRLIERMKNIGLVLSFQQGGLVPSPATVGQAPQAGLSELVNYTPRIAKEQNMNFPWLPQYQQGGLIPDAAAVGQAPPGVGQAPPGVGQAGQTAPPVSPQEIEAEIQRMMQSNPQGVLQIKQVIQEQLQTGQLTQQEFNLAGQLAQAAAQNPQLWPKLRAFAIQQGLAGENDLSQEFDAGLVFALLMAVRAVQSNIGGPGQPQATGQPGVPQQGQVAPPRPAGLAVPDASGQPPRRAFEGGGGAGKSRNIDGSISAVLHEGEFVIPQKVVQQKGTDFFNKLIDSDFGKSKGP
jgi:hypothetical protein